MKQLFWTMALALLVMKASLCAAEAPSVPGDAQGARRDAMLHAQLAKPYPGEGCWHYEDFALAAYWLNERTAEADQALLTERDKEFPASLKDGSFHLGGDESTTGIDPAREGYPAGQALGAIEELVPAGELVRRITAEAVEALERSRDLIG